MRRYSPGSPRVEGLDGRRRVRRDRRERAQQRVRVPLPVAGDEVDVVEVVAGEQPRAARQPGPHRDLVAGVEQAHLDPADPVGVRFHDPDHGVDVRRDVGRAEVAGQLRVERGAQPVQHDRRPGPGQHLGVDAFVVGGRRGGPGQVPAGHQHGAGAGVLGELQLLDVGVHHPRQRDDLVRRRGRCSPRPPGRRRPSAPRRRTARSARGSPRRPGPCCAGRCPSRRRRRGPTTRGGAGTPAWRPSRCRPALRARSPRPPAAPRARPRRRRGCAAAWPGGGRPARADSSQRSTRPPASTAVAVLTGPPPPGRTAGRPLGRVRASGARAG